MQNDALKLKSQWKPLNSESLSMVWEVDISIIFQNTTAYADSWRTLSFKVRRSELISSLKGKCWVQNPWSLSPKGWPTQQHHFQRYKAPIAPLCSMGTLQGHCQEKVELCTTLCLSLLTCGSHLSARCERCEVLISFGLQNTPRSPGKALHALTVWWLQDNFLGTPGVTSTSSQRTTPQTRYS